MSTKVKVIVYGVVGCVIGLLITLMIKLIFFSSLFWPMISLDGRETMTWPIAKPWEDPGYHGYYHLQDQLEKVEVTGIPDINQKGMYEIKYCFQGKHCKTRNVEVIDEKAPVISLKGERTFRIFENDEWKEPGYQAIDDVDGDLSKKVKVNGKINPKRVGRYKINYTVDDKSGNQASAVRIIEVCKDPTKMKLFYQFDEYDNTMEEWWIEKSENHQRNQAARTQDFLAKYDSYYIGNDEKVLYLTFDEGGKAGTKIKEIITVLNEHDVDATFFFTLNYIKDNPKLIRDLVKEGHVVANHTARHKEMPLLANKAQIDDFVKEITEVEKTYVQITGKPMEKIFRFPKGAMSERALKIMQALGYRTFFWSHAYYDYGETISKEMALSSMLQYHHNGAIYLIHPSNAGNYEAMGEFLDAMKKEGYRFGLVNEIGK